MRCNHCGEFPCECGRAPYAYRETFLRMEAAQERRERAWQAQVDELKARVEAAEARHYTASSDTRHTTLLMHFDGDAQTYLVGNYLGTVALDEAKARALELWPDAKFSVEA